MLKDYSKGWKGESRGNRTFYLCRILGCLHRQLLAVCDQNGLQDLPRQALQATRERMAKETRRGAVEKPGEYYQCVLLKLLEKHQIFVPTAGEDDPEEVRRQARVSLGLLVTG